MEGDLVDLVTNGLWGLFPSAAAWGASVGGGGVAHVVSRSVQTRVCTQPFSCHLVREHRRNASIFCPKLRASPVLHMVSDFPLPPSLCLPSLPHLLRYAVVLCSCLETEAPNPEINYLVKGRRF